jgi:hypothetical protein
LLLQRHTQALCHNKPSNHNDTPSLLPHYSFTPNFTRTVHPLCSHLSLSLQHAISLAYTFLFFLTYTLHTLGLDCFWVNNSFGPPSAFSASMAPLDAMN